MHIRRAAESESAELSAIAIESKAHWGYSVSQLEAWRGDLSISPASVEEWPTFVAEIDGQIVGFYLLKTSTAVWELEHFWVSRAFTGHGVGLRCMAHCV